jgi:DNA anti-recombination protein RmuC
VAEQNPSETEELRVRAHELETELEALRRAHEAQARQRIAERLALANEVEREVETLREEVEWRTEVMGEYEKQLDKIRSSRSYRYSAPVRRALARLRPHRG